ncbi:putative flavoprotein subunit of a reductase [Shewanella sediminis HAW-EB3]|uniref:Putative flavoprotein subunit of a reductase n=1 Tax=Shewanella sediminis (strain HAW-EB3) TaxID=425104 RepID=A8FWW5_SHESH|nr:FAD-dependent oxidoreductase [Shewanella sediminis]ABV37338.1 putative flavoprotein subunit of a reductase [Shewanella sediminis HAW-EB3]
MKKRTRFMTFTLAMLMSTLSAGTYATEKTITTDVVVVGGGSTGLTAALTAAEGGAKVIVLEKNPYLGGSSNFAEGLFAVESEYQRAASYGLTKDEAFKHIIEFNHNKIDNTIIRNYVNKAADNIDWLNEQGVDFRLIQISPEEPRVWHIIEDKKPYIHGGALITTLQQKAKKLGVQFLLRTPAKKLIYSNNRVTGVEAVDHKGNKIVLKAKAVVIATGGFGNSKEKIAKWTNYNPETFLPALPLNKTGDGIQMAKDVGAKTEGEGLMVYLGARGTGIIPMQGINAMTWQPTNLWVNSSGERFTNEAVAFSFGQAANSVGRQHGNMAWAIFDDASVDYAAQKGIDQGIGVIIPTTTKLTGLRDEINNALAVNSDGVKTAESIEALAKQIDVPMDTLIKSYHDYNAYSKNGYDPQFVKDHKWLRPLNHGNLYAIKMMPNHFASIGGLNINTKMQVLGHDNQPISGLYAGGLEVGGLYGDTYTLWASGHAYGFSIHSGRTAGASILKAIK